MAITTPDTCGRDQALAHLKSALDVWRVDPDEASAEEQKAWADLLDVANTLARITKAEAPAG
ncbi:MAG: hypothetical protein V4521_00520 [Pseudomonadota bacterium]